MNQTATGPSPNVVSAMLSLAAASQQHQASTSNAPTPPILPNTMAAAFANLQQQQGTRPPIPAQQAAALMAAAAAALAAQQQRQQQGFLPRPLMPATVVRPPVLGLGPRANLLPGPPLPSLQNVAGSSSNDRASSGSEEEDGKSPRKARVGKVRSTMPVIRL